MTKNIVAADTSASDERVVRAVEAMVKARDAWEAARAADARGGCIAGGMSGGGVGEGGGYCKGDRHETHAGVRHLRETNSCRAGAPAPKFKDVLTRALSASPA